MLASPGPWRLGVAVALRSRSPQTAAKLARSGSIRFYSILFYSILQGSGSLQGWAGEMSPVATNDLDRCSETE